MWRFLYHLGLCALLGLTGAAWADDGGETPESPAVEEQTEADVVEADVQPTKPVSSPETTEATKAPVPSVAAAQSVPMERVTVSASATFRMLAVSDPDPANDRSMLYGLSARAVLDGLTTSATSLTTRFVAEEGDLPVRPRPRQCWVSTPALGQIPTVAHRIGAWLPTSRSSLYRELRVVPTVRSSVNYAVIGPLSVGPCKVITLVPIRGGPKSLGHEHPMGIERPECWRVHSRQPHVRQTGFQPSSGPLDAHPSLDQHESETADAVSNQMFTQQPA